MSESLHHSTPYTSCKAVEAGMKASSRVRWPAEAPPYLDTADTAAPNAADPENQIYTRICHNQGMKLGLFRKYQRHF